MNKKVKCLTVYKTNYNNIDGLNFDYDASENYHHYTEFNANGNLIKEIFYTEDGIVEQEIYYNYNDKQLVIEEKVLDEFGEFLERKVFEYDNDGKLLKKMLFYIDDSFDTTFYTYENNNLIEKKLINSDEEVEEIEKFEYESSNLIKHIVYDSNNIEIKRISSKYDNKNKVLEMQEWNSDENKEYRTMFEYDDKDRRTETLIYVADKLIARQQLIYDDVKDYIIEVIDEDQYKKNHTFIKYDEHGNNIEQMEYNRNEELNNKITKAYNEFNQIISTDVLVDKHGEGLNQHYAFRYDYIYL